MSAPKMRFADSLYYPSLLDAFGAVSLTVFACGCHLRCPFCHNGRIAENKAECIELTVDGLIRVFEEYEREGAEVLTVTGGEPLLTRRNAEFLAELSHSVPLNVNSSLTVSPAFVDALLSKGSVKRVSFDVKEPMSITGMPVYAQAVLYRNFVSNVRRVAESGAFIEMRVPVSTLLTPQGLEATLSDALGDRKADVAVVQQLVSFIDVRRKDWPYFPDSKQFAEIADEVSEVLRRYAKKVVVRAY